MGYTGEKKREYQRQWMAARRAEWFAENGPCALCGSWDDLELDHVDPATKVHHVVWSWSKARREAELAKCRALCETCHKAKSKTEVVRGEQNGAAKLTAQLVREIRVSDLPHRQIARMVGVDEKNIRLIRQRKIWAHVE